MEERALKWMMDLSVPAQANTKDRRVKVSTTISRKEIKPVITVSGFAYLLSL